MSCRVHHQCHTSVCSGPVPSHKKDAVVVIDFMGKPELPRIVETLCGKETNLDKSNSSIHLGEFKTKYIACPTDEKEVKENFSDDSFSSLKTDDTESDGVDSSQKKLVPTPNTSYIEMNNVPVVLLNKKRHHSEKEKCCSLRNFAQRIVQAKQYLNDHKKIIFFIFKILLYLGVTGYMLAALVMDFHRALPLLVFWCLIFFFTVYGFICNRHGKRILTYCHSFASTHSCGPIKKILQVCFCIMVLVCVVVWLALDTAKRPKQLISVLGYFVFLFIIFVFSKHPDRVNWRPVIWGLTFQFCLGLVILRTSAGFDIFNWCGQLAQTFINYVSAGTDFVFGSTKEHFFAFKVLPIIVYFSAFISVLYYLGAMQWLISKIAWIMQITLNTSATESMVAAGNIFVGQTESPLLIRPYILDLTTSELHAVMTAGFGTIAGSVLGAYLGFGIKAVYVMTACVMAAPCALALSKLSYPETKDSKFKSSEGLVLEKTEQRNVVEAAFVGASQAIPLVLNIGANLIAFLSLLAAFNGFLSWFGSLTGYDRLSFQVICSYLFMPLTFLMGVDWQDCFKAAELIGTKIFINEFIAYGELSNLIKARDNGTIPKFDPLTGETNWVDERTEAIVTYALCGFANVGSLGIMLGGLGSMAPKRQGEMANIVLRALVAGIFVSILNACVAGFLYVPGPIKCVNILNATDWSFTDPSRLHYCCSTVLQTNLSVAENCCLNFNWTSTNLDLNCTDFM